MIPYLNNIKCQFNQINNHKTVDTVLLKFSSPLSTIYSKIIINLNVSSFKFTIYAELYTGAFLKMIFVKPTYTTT